MKKFILQTSLFVGLALVINIIVQFIIVIDREPQLFELKAKLSKPMDCIYFGSSVNIYYKPWWKDIRDVAVMIDSLSPDIKVTGISRSSASIENYYNYLSYSLKCGNSPKIVVIPINIRAFSYEWGKRPEYATRISKENIFLNKGILAFIFRKIIPRYHNELNRQTHEAYFNEDVIINEKIEGKVKDFIVEDKGSIKDTAEHYKKSYMVNYMSDITIRDQKVKYLIKMDSLCKRNNIETVYYLTPVDYMAGEKFLGNEITEKLCMHSDFFKNLLAEKQDHFVDLLFALDSRYFTYELMPNEHLFAPGKRYIAKEISKEINAILKKKR